MTADELTAAPDSIARRRPERISLGDVWRAFARRASPKLIAAAIAAALALRLALGHWSWRDALIGVALVALEPLTEWVIHVYLLHARPIRIAGRRIDLPTAREHREHHRAPGVLDGVLIPTYGIAIFIPLIALTVWALSFPIHALIGGDRVAGAASGLLAAYAILGAYEWTHFLIHAPYRPQRRYYRTIWRSHRLHHYKNERYWFGVTSNLGDQLLGTNPRAEAVERSRTARALHDSSAETA